MDAEREGLIAFIRGSENGTVFAHVFFGAFEMTIPAYDIFNNEKLGLIWIEAIEDMETAKSRIAELARQSHGEYIVMDQRRGRIVANTDSRPATSRTPFES